jgi:hypothetical protein
MRPLVVAGVTVFAYWAISRLAKCLTSEEESSACPPSLAGLFQSTRSSPETVKPSGSLVGDRISLINAKMDEAFKEQVRQCIRIFFLIYLVESHTKNRNFANPTPDDINRVIEKAFRTPFNSHISIDIENDPAQNRCTRLSLGDIYQVVEKALKELEKCQENGCFSKLPAFTTEGDSKACLTLLTKQDSGQTKHIQQLMQKTEQLWQTYQVIKNGHSNQNFLSLIESQVESSLQKQTEKPADHSSQISLRNAHEPPFDQTETNISLINIDSVFSFTYAQNSVNRQPPPPPQIVIQGDYYQSQVIWVDTSSFVHPTANTGRHRTNRVGIGS